MPRQGRLSESTLGSKGCSTGSSRRWGVVAVATVAIPGLAACTGIGKTSIPTTIGTTATAGGTPPSHSATPDKVDHVDSNSTPAKTRAIPAPVANIPPTARPNTKAGAQEFVKYFPWWGQGVEATGLVRRRS